MSVRDLGRIAINTLTEGEARAELERLATEIAEHDRHYYQEDRPTILDAAYDALRQRNEAIEKRFPAFVGMGSPSRLVGPRPSGPFAKVRHAMPMLSLDRVLGDKDVVEFVARVRRLLGLGDKTAVFNAVPKVDCQYRCAMSVALSSTARRAVTALRVKTSPPT